MLDSILFVGDSLTENHNNSTYTASLISRLLPQYDGFKQFDYLPLTTSHTKLMGEYDQIVVKRTNPATVIHMWGDSDHRWEQSPYKYSPDGKGFYVEESNREQIFITTKGLLKVTKIKIFYLKQPNGCRFSFGYSAQPANQRISIDTDSSIEELAVVDIDATHLSNNLIVSLDGNGNKFAAYGIQFIDDSEEKGLIYNVFARGGSTLEEHNQLVNIEAYYQSIQPTIAVINLGTNDALQRPSQLTALQFKEQFQLWVNRIRNVCPNIKIFVIEPNRSSIYGISKGDDTRGLLFPLYTKVRKEIVNENSNMKYIDLPSLTGDYDYYGLNGWMLDELHPNSEGKLQITNAIYPYLEKFQGNVTYNMISDSRFYEPVVSLNSIYGVSKIGNKWTPLKKYGLKGQNIKSFFDIEVVASKSGRQWVSNLRFYGVKNKRPDFQINHIRGLKQSQIYRYDKVDFTSRLRLRAVKTKDNRIEIQAKIIGFSKPEATEWVLSGKVKAAALNFLQEF